MLLISSRFKHKSSNIQALLWSHSTKPIWAWWCLGLMLIAVITFGHDHFRVLQLIILALPCLFILLIPIKKRHNCIARNLLVGMLITSFVLDSVVRQFITRAYQALPESSLILSALANTTSREAFEFLALYGSTMFDLIILGLVTLTFITLLVFVAGASATQSHALRIQSVWLKCLLIIALLLCAIAFAVKPWRKLHPFIYWPQLANVTLDLKDSWSDLQLKRDKQLHHAQNLFPTVGFNEESTIVLVVSDSINRHNMSTHGYQRQTTPQLLALSEQHPHQLLNFQYAWSVKAATIPSLEGLFNLKEHAQTPVHLLALARAANYHVTWISNHDDRAIEQKHARLANHVDLLNYVPGRNANISDEVTHQPLLEALKRPHPRKLIVVHLLGAHPNYSKRYPEGKNIFAGTSDQVTKEMQKQGRSNWLIDRRNEYDSAIHNHDKQIAHTLELTKQAIGEGERGAWVFVSDHGQEVGHTKNYAGHSATTPDGFRIPAFIWSTQAFEQANNQLEKRPFRLDWLGWTMTSLMGIDWSWENTGKDILNKDYQFTPPQLETYVSSFKQ